MDFAKIITDFCQTLKRKKYVVGIVSNLSDNTIFLDIYLEGNPISFHLSGGTLHYSYLMETILIEIQYYNLNTFTKDHIEETNSYLILERLKTGTIHYDKTKKLSYYQKLLISSFQNPLLKLYQKEKSHLGF